MADLIFPNPGRRTIVGQWYYEQPDGSKGPLGPAITQHTVGSHKSEALRSSEGGCGGSPTDAKHPEPRIAMPHPDGAIFTKMVAGLSYDELMLLRQIVEKKLQAQFVLQAAALSITE